MTTANTAFPGRIRLDNVRLLYPTVFEPEQFQGEGEFAYTCSLLMPPDHPQMKALRKVAETIALNKWADGAGAVMKSAWGKDMNCLHDGNLKGGELYEDMFYVSCRNSGSKGRMPVLKPSIVITIDGVNRTRGDFKDAKELEQFDKLCRDKIYMGAYVNASIELWAQDNGFGKRVNAQIRGLQFLRDGDVISGGASAARGDDFAAVTEGANAEEFA